MNQPLYFVWNEFYGGLQVCTAEEVASIGPEFTFFKFEDGKMYEYNTYSQWSQVTSEFNQDI